MRNNVIIGENVLRVNELSSGLGNIYAMKAWG